MLISNLVSSCFPIPSDGTPHSALSQRLRPHLKQSFSQLINDSIHRHSHNIFTSQFAWPVIMIVWQCNLTSVYCFKRMLQLIKQN
jgi:hypothetical protein